MRNDKKYMINPSADDAASDFPGIDLQFPESKEEVWAKIVSQIDSKRIQPKHSPFVYKFALAASIILLLGITAFLKFYTRTIYCPAGQHLTVMLPDSSKVELNAQSSINYHPYWTKLDRHVNLDGEAYFKVKPGARFKVISTRGETIVLGTTFNIYARGDDYKVSCFTGSVRVVSALNKRTIVLLPNQQAFVQADGTLKFIHSSNIEANKSWTQNMFIFTGASLKSVIQEIERQYNIKINTQGDFNLTYTGNFNKSISEKDVLDLVCTSLELKFEAKSNDEYLIYKPKR
jgi:transmembrane sensor